MTGRPWDVVGRCYACGDPVVRRDAVWRDERPLGANPTGISVRGPRRLLHRGTCADRYDQGKAARGLR